MKDQLNRAKSAIPKLHESAPPAPVGFPALTKEDLEEINQLFLDLVGKFGNTMPGLEEYTGQDRSIGEGSIYHNSRVTLYQFLYSLALTRHSLVKKISSPDFKKSDFKIKDLVDNKIMKGMKILDLGSGPIPVFSRVCRAMGADIWTVDEEDFSDAYNEAEKKYHITIGLGDKNALSTILKKTSGNFNLVSEAALIPPCNFYRPVILPLIKRGGVWYVSPELDSKLKE